MTNSDENDWLKRRLDAIVLLLMDAHSDAPLSHAARIEKLQGLGFRPSETAKIIGKDLSFVTATLAKKKKKSAPKAKKKGAGASVTATSAEASATSEEAS